MSKPLKIACQMDPIEKIDIRGDSTFALLLEAQARGHHLFYYVPQTLTLDGTVLKAVGSDIRVRDEVGNHVSIEPQRNVDLSTFDVVLLRQDPPFDLAYITTTHLLERIHPKTLVVNDPKEVRNAPEKLWVLDFPDLMPPTLVTRDMAAIKAFRAQHKDIIVKPLFGNGGAGVFRIQPGDTNLGSLYELYTTMARDPLMVQQYRPEVRAGDKRVILIDGEPIAGLNRVPAADETRSNLHVGGTPKATDLTPRELEICARLGPELKRRGLIFTGIDVIGGYLTEINVTSPTGMRQIKAFGGPDIPAKFWDVVEARVGRR
jgi:glutathione synthase